jgi:ribosomal protein L11 methyltransferase
MVRATFHSGLPAYPIEIVVDPKMSFGTGHHATTHQMISAQLKIQHKGKSVLDLGTGTGILAITAAKLGASHIEGSDIDEWCIENSRENFLLNDLADITLQKTAAQNFICSEPFDIVLANINKNVLLDEMQYYAAFCKRNGHLLLSGFYEKDISDINEAAFKLGFVLQTQQAKDDWAQLTFIKSE